MELKKIAASLLHWFHRNQRDLPWRRTKDPYRIWVSEVMLQQTQVETVIPYYHRWLRAFPTVKVLAGASLSEVLKLWEGLGYYARARNLHRAAKIIVKNHGGKFPNSAEALRKLPGIGRYTAGAVASIAFNEPEPVLDGNVKRVLARLGAIRQSIDTSAGEKRLWESAKTLVEIHPSKAGDFNQSLMELGALLCLPERPKCSICPVRRFCEAHRMKKEEAFPIKLKREKVERLRTVAAVIWKNGQVLLEKQPLHSRWGGLWTFPQWVVRNGKGEKAILKDNLLKEFSIRSAGGLIPKMTVRHGFTKYRVRLRVYEGTLSSLQSAEVPDEAVGSVILRRPVGPTKNLNLRSFARQRRAQDDNKRSTRWVRPQQLPRLALPRPHRKIAAFLLNQNA